MWSTFSCEESCFNRDLEKVEFKDLNFPSQEEIDVSDGSVRADFPRQVHC